MSAVQKGCPENSLNNNQRNQNQGIRIAKVPNRARQSWNPQTKGSQRVALDIKAYTNKIKFNVLTVRQTNDKRYIYSGGLNILLRILGSEEGLNNY